MRQSASAIFAQNRPNTTAYQILETYEAGLVLTGAETKAVRIGQVALRGAYVQIRAGEAWLERSSIGPYPPAAQNNPPKLPGRKLLLQRSELQRLAGFLSAKGLTALPVSVYSKQGRIKVTIAVVRRKKTLDKREKIKTREIRRDIQKLIR